MYVVTPNGVVLFVFTFFSLLCRVHQCADWTQHRQRHGWKSVALAARAVIVPLLYLQIVTACLCSQSRLFLFPYLYIKTSFVYL